MSNVIVMNNSYNDPMALYNVMHYCAGTYCDHLKCEFWGGYGVRVSSVDNAIYDMNYVKRYFRKTGGRELCHFVITLYRKTESKNETYLRTKLSREMRECNYFADAVSQMIYGEGFQNCYFKHIDSDKAHVHYVINSVNFISRKKIKNVASLAYAVRTYLNTLYISNWQDILFRKGEDMDSQQ